MMGLAAAGSGVRLGNDAEMASGRMSDYVRP
jgi:hypothetical protein